MSLTAFPTPDGTTTSSASATASVAGNIAVVQPGSQPAQTDGSNHAVAIALGAVAGLAIVVVGLATYQRNTQRKRLHSSRVVIMPVEHVSINPSSISMRRMSFEPTPARSEV